MLQQLEAARALSKMVTKNLLQLYSTQKACWKICCSICRTQRTAHLFAENLRAEVGESCNPNSTVRRWDHLSWSRRNRSPLRFHLQPDIACLCIYLAVICFSACRKSQHLRLIDRKRATDSVHSENRHRLLLVFRAFFKEHQRRKRSKIFAIDDEKFLPGLNIKWLWWLKWPCVRR